MRTALTLALAAALLPAQSISVEGPVPGQPRPGERFEFTVHLADGTGDAALIPPAAVDGLDLAAGPRRRAGGDPGSGEAIRYSWTVEGRASREGDFTIPPIAVATEGGPLRTGPIAVRVRAEPGLGAFGSVELSVQPATVYAGQSFSVRTTVVLVREFIEDSLVPMFRQRTDLPAYLELPRAAGAVSSAPAREADPAGGPTYIRDRSIARTGPLEDAVHGGRPAIRFHYEERWTAQEPGDLTIRPPALRFAYATRFREDLILGRVPEDRREGTLPGNGLAVRVRPLPPPPAGGAFSGAIGEFRLRAELAGGGPGGQIRILVVAEGDGDFPEGRVPEIGPIERYHVLAASPVPGGSPGAATFVFDLEPAGPELADIRGIAITAFNPRTGAYERVHAAPVPIPADVAAAHRTEASRSGGSLPPAPPRRAWRSPGQVPPQTGRDRTAAMAGLAALAGAAIATALLLPRLRDRDERAADPAGYRAARAVSAFRRALDRGRDPLRDPLRDSLAEALSALLRRPPAAAIGPDLRRDLEEAGVPGPLAELAAAQMERLAGVPFGGEYAADEIEQARALAAGLDAWRRGGRGP